MALEFDKEQEKEAAVTYGNQLELVEPESPEAPEFDDVDDDIVVPEEDQQLNMFDDDEPKKAPKKKVAAASKPAPEVKVGTGFTVYYAGHRIPVPQEEMTLDAVRQYLESDFPELSKERTEMLMNKEKNEVVPVVKGAKKG